MRRRNFFATLFAPLIARFAPKPKPSILDDINAGINPGWGGDVFPTYGGQFRNAGVGIESTAKGFADYVATQNPSLEYLLSKNVGTLDGGTHLSEMFIYPKED
jgi:hypothetical protein